MSGIDEVHEALGKVRELFATYQHLAISLVVERGEVQSFSFDAKAEAPKRRGRPPGSGKKPVWNAGRGRKSKASNKESTKASAASESPATKEQILRILNPPRMKQGLNLTKLAKKLGVTRKMSIKPLLEEMVEAGELELQRVSFRIPGRVTQGRGPGKKTAKEAAAKKSASKVAKRRGRKPAAKKAVKRAPVKKPTTKTATKGRKGSAANSRRPSAKTAGSKVQKPETAEKPAVIEGEDRTAEKAPETMN